MCGPDFSSPSSNVIFEKQPSCPCLVRSPARRHKTPETAFSICCKKLSILSHAEKSVLLLIYNDLPQHAIGTKQLFTGKLALLLEHQPIFGLQHMHWHMLNHQVDAGYMITKLIDKTYF